MNNYAEFSNSSKAGRMGIKVEPFSKFFVSGIKKAAKNYRFQESNKTWYFDAESYEAIKALVVEAYAAADSQNNGELIIRCADGSTEAFNMPKARNEWPIDGEKADAFRQDAIEARE